eukprot:jgi/Hompol1/377/HPOL_000235-RA
MGFARASDDIIAKFKEPKPKDIKDATSVAKDPFGFEENPDDLKFLLDCFMDIALYSTPAGRVMTALNAAEITSKPPPTALDVIPAGLSKNAVVLITNNLKAAWCHSNQDVRDLKVKLVRFVMTESLVPEKLFVLEKFMIYLVCAADSFSDVQSIGDDGLKRYAKPDFEKPEVVFKLYSLYLGSATSAQSPSQIIEFLLRSSRATNQFPQMIQVAFDALYGENTTHKLRAAGMSFVQWVARMAETDKIVPVAPVLFSGLLKFIGETSEQGGTESESLRGFAYESVGLLSKRGAFIPLTTYYTHI